MVVGCAMFVLIEQTRLIMSFGFNRDTELEFTILLFIFGVLLMIAPTVIGSSTLALILSMESMKNLLIQRNAILLGIFVGVIVAFGVVLLGTLLTNGRGSLYVFFLHIIEIMSIAALCGGWTGMKIYKLIVL